MFFQSCMSLLLAVYSDVVKRSRERFLIIRSRHFCFSGSTSVMYTFKFIITMKGIDGSGKHNFFFYFKLNEMKVIRLQIVGVFTHLIRNSGVVFAFPR